MTAILFDLDGTLLDSIKAIVRTINATLAEFGLPPFPDGDVDRLVGMSLVDILRARTEDIQPMVERYRELHMSTFKEDTKVFEGTRDLLDRLQDEGHRMAVITLRNGDLASKVIDHFDMLDYFEAVLGWNNVPKAKPSPEHALKGCEVLGTEATQTTLVGDSRYDMMCGYAANCRTIGVTWGSGNEEDLREAGADNVANDFEELYNIIKEKGY